jgi:hypothetical protein
MSLVKKSKKHVVHLIYRGGTGTAAHPHPGCGTASARTLSRARILLKANQGEGAAEPAPLRLSPRRWGGGALHCGEEGAQALRE